MPLLRRARAFGVSFFRRFGVHCATHQIRVILISSVVISCLLFPAIAIYSSTQTASFSLSFRVFDALLTPDDLSNYFALDDVRHLWENHDVLRVRDDSVARARCGKGGIVRLERVLVHHVSDVRDAQSVLDHRTLLSTLRLEHRLSELLAARRSPCIRSPHGRCLVLSPLSFWDHDEDALMRDPNILDTLGPAKNTSAHGLTITADMVLAGRGDGDGSLFGSGDDAYPVLTYFFPESDCLANHGHHFWLNIVEDAAASVDSESIVLTQAPRLLALEYDKGRAPTGRPTVLTVFVYSAYLIFFVYFWRSMRRMDTVHSRIGLAFTGIVEIVVSTITSLSVCALVGFRVTMVPWEIFPIVVIFIGVENMFSIVDAVIKTSITLPVKERIAEGLGYAGTSNSLKLCTYNSVLGAIAFFSSGAIRQFCAFAIVVLVAHWFLVHTFFVTVLSIDIQRLELDELLRQNASLAPSLSTESTTKSAKKPHTKFGKFMSGLQHALRGRPAKNISLVLLLAITATLYYMTQPHSANSHIVSPPARGRFKHDAASLIEGASPAEHVWRTFNPSNYDLVHVRVEAPTILLARHDSGPLNRTSDQQHRLDYDRPHRSRWAKLWLRMARPTAWLVKIIAVPTFVTTTLLYGLLLYLLKDAELLEAQRNRVEADSPPPEETTAPVGESVSFTTLPRAFATDIDLIAANKDGNIVATVGLQSELVIWRRDTRTYLAVDTTDILLGSSGSTPSASSALTAIAVSDSGTYVAVGTAAGAIGMWCIGQNRVQALPSLVVDNLSSVTQIHFAPSPTAATGKSMPKVLNGSLDRAVIAELAAGLYATYDNGAAIKWSVGTHAAPTYLRPSRSTSVVKSMLLQIHADDRLLVGFALDDGMLELSELDRPTGLLPPDRCILAGNPADLVTKADVCMVELEGKPHVVVGAATQAGVISLWDGRTGERMIVLDDVYGPISNLRITPVPMKRCSTCRELPVESFSIFLSVGQVVLFYRAYLSLPTRKCSCPVNQPKLISSVVGRKSRSGSVASTVGPSSGTASPVLSRSRPALSTSTSFEALGMYPVSGHGAHSRRASDKRLEPFAEADETDGRSPVGPQDVPAQVATTSAFLTPGQQPSSLWENLFVTPTAEASFERGSWDVMNNKVVGIRRRPRMPMMSGGSVRGSSKPVPKTQSRIESSKGLTPSTLERWELWTFDPSETRLQASPLINLDADTHSSTSPRDEPIRRNLATGFMGQPGVRRSGADVVPRLHFTRVAPLVCGRSFCLAGFGNTVGLLDFGPASPSARPKISLERL